VSDLRPFWFRFEPMPTPTPINLGCGVTAFSREDALALLQERVFGANGVPRLVEVIDDITRAALDSKHVVPNLGKLEERGVWFPQGYDEPR
jgi:hypothetical protein